MNFPPTSSPPPGVTNRKPNVYPFSSNASTHHPSSSLPSSSAPYSSAQVASTLENQNDLQIERLHEKANMLKHLTINLGDEIQESNKFLDSMSTTFVQTDSLLGSASRRLQDLSRSSGANFGCYITVFIFAVLLFVYFGLSRK